MSSLGSPEGFYGWLRRVNECPVYVVYCADHTGNRSVTLRFSGIVRWCADKEEEHEAAKALLLKRLKAGCPVAALIYQEYVTAKLK